MDIQVLASGSKANAYTIYDGRTTLLIECGLSLKELQKKLKYKLCSTVSACLVSHHHKDHSKAVNSLLDCGIDIYIGNSTADELQLNKQGRNVKIIEVGKQCEIVSFIVIPFNLVHCNTDFSECECLGYLIYSTHTKEKLLFATDTAYIHNKFNGINYYMIECNYIASEIDKENESEIYQRLLHSHMSLEECVVFFQNQDLSIAKKILLLHISNERGNAEQILKAIKRETGKLVELA